MNNNHPDRVTAFDSLFTTNHIQMLKLLLSYMEPPVQRQLAIYIKFLELEYTLRFFQNHPAATMPLSPGLNRPENGIGGLLDDILPFCSDAEKEKIMNFKNMYRNMENIQEMMQTIEMLREISPELFSGSGSSSDSGSFGNASDFSGILSGLGDMDMSQITEMIEMMQVLFNSKND